MPDTPIPIVSFFSGAGGLDLGFRQEKFRVLLACDNSQAAVNSYNLNTKEKVAKLTDLASTKVSDLIDLITATASGMTPQGVIGGPPCQGFSVGNASADPKDPRNFLPFRYAEILGQLNKRFQLKFFVFENVLGLMRRRHFNRFYSILKAFEKAGFNVAFDTLNANQFGVAQNRPRLFVVGLNKSLFPGVTFEFPEGRSHGRTIRDVIHGMPKPVFFDRHLNARDIPFHANHWTMVPKSAKFKSKSATDGRSFRKLVWDGESPAVAYGNREIHVHPKGGRRLSVYEAILLQGFHRRFRLTGNFSEQVTQISNAVPPPVARALARRIRATVLA